MDLRDSMLVDFSLFFIRYSFSFNMLLEPVISSLNKALEIPQ